MRNGFVTVCACSPELYMGDPKRNSERINALITLAAGHGAKVMVFPELSLTGAGCGDLFGQRALLESAGDAVYDIAEHTRELDMLVAVGAPVDVGGRLYNCAVVMAHGKVLGVVPQSAVSNSRFAPTPAGVGEAIVGGMEVPFGADLIFESLLLAELRVAVTVGDELRAAFTPAEKHTAAGANIILNLSAENMTAGAQRKTRSDLLSLSEKLGCCIVRADAGRGETEGAHIAYDLIAENGELLSENRDELNGVLACDVDTQLLEGERLRRPKAEAEPHRTVYFDLKPSLTPLLRSVRPAPFVTQEGDAREEWCADMVEMQADHLVTRVQREGYNTLVVPLAGDLGTTIAAMACARAGRKLGWEGERIVGVVTPCRGLSRAATNRAMGLARELSLSVCRAEMDDTLTARLDFLGVNEGAEPELSAAVRDRARLSLAVDLADQVGGMLVCGEDMTDWALGEIVPAPAGACRINAGIPKTVMRFLLIYILARQEELRGLCNVLQAVLAESAGGASPNHATAREEAEQIIFTPLQMNDFFLYHILRHGFGPMKLERLAENAFGKQLDELHVYDCLHKFLTRFFDARGLWSSGADCPKIVEPALCGAFSLPDDADFRLWLDELEAMAPEGYTEQSVPEPEPVKKEAPKAEETEEERAARLAEMVRLEKLAQAQIERERAMERGEI